MEKITINLKQVQERLEDLKADALTVVNKVEGIIRDVKTQTFSFEVLPTFTKKTRKPRVKKRA